MSKFVKLRSKTASQDRCTGTKQRQLIRWDSCLSKAKIVFIIVAVLAVLLPLNPVCSASYPEVLSDYIDVGFELMEETPVSVKFDVTVTSSLRYDLTGIPLNIQIDGTTVKTITLYEHQRVSYEVMEPVYGEVKKSYTSKVGIYKITGDAKGNEPQVFIDYDREGNILFEGSYKSIDERTGTITWTETEQVGERKASKTEEILTPTIVKNPATKVKPVLLDIPAKESTVRGYGGGTLRFTVEIDTGLQLTNSGWGSAGVMTWQIAGKDYKDLENSSWWQTNWLYKRRITIDATDVADDLDDFPFIVTFDNTQFNFNHCQSDGDDFRFLDANNQNLAYEIDRASDFKTSALFYIRVPLIEALTDDGYIDMYYGNNMCGAGENIHGTWRDEYVAVFHMNDSPDGLGILDSTQYQNHGTKGVGSQAPTEVDGLVGKAQSFDGVGDELLIPHAASISVSSGLSSGYTLEVAIKTSQASGVYRNIISKAWFSPYGEYALTLNQGKLAAVLSGWKQPNGALLNDGEYHLVGAYFSPNGKGGLFEDGSITFEYDMGDNPISNNLDIKLGSHSSYYAGNKDEIRISSTAWGDSWIGATDKTLRAPESFYTLGAESWADIPQGPIDLVYTVDGSDIVLAWSKGLRADTTVILRKEGSYPTSPNDGVLVYDGAGTSIVDIDASTETNELYYRAWSYNDWGYSIEYAQARKGAIMTELIMVLGLTAFALWRREMWVYLPAVIALILFGMRWAATDLMFGIPFFALAIFMAARLGWVFFQRARE